MPKKLVVAPERCTGCNGCILECSFKHHNYFSFAKSRIHVAKEPERAISIPRVCIQCDEAPCIETCPVGALFKDEDTGATMLNEQKCTGCRECVSACPYEGIFFDEERAVPLICDLCGGEPACASTCLLPQAIRVEERGSGGAEQ